MAQSYSLSSSIWNFAKEEYEWLGMLSPSDWGEYVPQGDGRALYDTLVAGGVDPNIAALHVLQLHHINEREKNS